MKPNPPIKGHHLKHEGKMYALPRFRSGYQVRGYRVEGGCQCGALPPDIWRYFTPTNEPDIWRSMGDQGPPLLPSMNAVKRWHRQHKDELRSQRP